MSEQTEAQENKDISLDEAFFEYLRQDLFTARDLFINLRDNVLGAVEKPDGEYMKVQTAFTIGKMYAVLSQLLDVIPYAFEKRGIQDNSIRDYVINAIKALAKAYTDIVVFNRPLSDIRDQLQQTYEDLDDMLTKSIKRLVEA